MHSELTAALNREDLLIGLSMALTVGGVLLGAGLREPNAFGVTALAVMGFLIIGWWMTGSARLAWLLIFGVAAGVLELWADWVHVTHFGSLVYTDYFGFRLLASPSYMPIGWGLTVVQFGYLALRLRDRWKPWIAVSAVTILGMALPPWYEELAAPAQAWYYTTGGPMLSHTPVWIIFTYGGCMFAIATTALIGYQPRSWGRAVLGGLFTAAGIMFSGVFWYSLLG